MWCRGRARHEMRLEGKGFALETEKERICLDSRHSIDAEAFGRSAVSRETCHGNISLDTVV